MKSLIANFQSTYKAATAPGATKVEVRAFDVAKKALMAFDTTKVSETPVAAEETKK